MEEKSQTKISVHQILIKNGFYRLPMQSLSEILKLLEMPESLEPKTIQQNAIAGLIKIIQKYNNKFGDYVNQLKYHAISRQTKDFVNLLLQDTLTVLSIKNNIVTPQIPPLIPQSMPSPGIPNMFNPINPFPYGRPPNVPPEQPADNSDSAAQQNRYIEEAIRMQQMYMYYYGMYGGFNPMMNPQYLGINPYAPFGQMNNPNKTQPGNSQNNPISALSQLNPLGQINPMVQNINPMGMPGFGPMASLGGALHNQKMPSMMSNQIAKSKFTDQMSALLNSNQRAANYQISKEGQLGKNIMASKVRQAQDKKTDKNYQPMDFSRISTQNILHEGKKTDKRKINEYNNQKQKLTVLNPPFIVGQVSPYTPKKISQRQMNKQTMNQFNVLRYCACKGSQRFEQKFLCAICNRTFHFQCLNEPVKRYQIKEAVQCYHCRMRFIDPLNKVKEVIAEHYIPNISESKFWLQCNLKPYDYLCRPKDKSEAKNQIQMRCLKVCHAQNNEITWPDECIIKLNGQRIIQIPALQMNSSLKKRKDYSIIITPNIYNKINQADSQSLQKIKLSLEIKPLSKDQMSHKKIKNNYTFAFAIYFIERLTVDQLYHRIVAQQKVPQPPQYMQRLMRTGQKDIQIDKITVSIRDPFTWDLIKMPVRGHKCQHGQCFDLKTFISFMSTARNRTWKCPVCNKDARKFMIDSQQLGIIKRIQQNSSIPSQITFMKSGQILLKADNQSDDQDLNSGAKSEKTKKIIKSPKPQKNSRPQRQQQSRQEKSQKQKQGEVEQSKKAAVKQIVLDIIDDDDDENQGN